MVYTPEVFINNSSISHMTSTPVKKSSARKSQCMSTDVLDVKNKTVYCQVGATKFNRKSIKFGNTPWALKKKIEKGTQKIDEKINKYLYNWIMYHPQVVQSPIVNDCLMVKIYCHTELQLVPNFLLQVSVFVFELKTVLGMWS